MPGFADDFAKIAPHLRRFARALAPGHGAQAADDLVQEAVVLAARADLPRRGPALAVWCFSALIQLNRARHHRGARPGAEEPAPGALPFVPKEVLRLDALSLEQREVLLLVALAGLGYDQVAEVLGIDLGLVFARLTQARDGLARAGDDAARRPARDRGRPSGSTSHLRLVK